MSEMFSRMIGTLAVILVISAFIGGSTPTEIIDNVKHSIDDFINGNSQFDDMTMLCFSWHN